MNISIIIPIHEYNEKISDYLSHAIKSIANQEGIDEPPQLILVFPPEIENDIKTLVLHNSAIDYVVNVGKTDYQSQVNLAVESVTTDYFSVLEFDDEYSTGYFKNSSAYIKSYPEIDIFLTMMVEVNEKNEGVKITNETVWSQQFVGENGEMGYLNANALKQYTDFKLSGAIIKKSEFKNVGKYKSNIKLTFMYEYLLRALNNACKVYSMPKIGYKHQMNREGSLFDGYLKNMPVSERKFWFETATNEANFINDRVIDMTRLTK